MLPMTLSLPTCLLISLLVSTIGDALTFRSWRDEGFGWWVMDGLQHGAVGLAVTLPVTLTLAEPVHASSWVLTGALAVAFASATLVDVDHLVRIPAWWPMSASDHKHRRALHSLLVALVLGALAWLIGGSVSGSAIRGLLWGWVPIAGVLCHLFRDSCMGTVPIFFPVRFPLKWPRPVYYAAELGLTYASYALVRGLGL